MIGLDIEGTKAEVPIFRGRTPRETTKRKESAKHVVAEVRASPEKIPWVVKTLYHSSLLQLMIKKLFSKHLHDSVLNEYLKQKAKIPVRDRKSDSFLRTDVPEWAVLSVDHLGLYGIVHSPHHL